MTRISVKQQRWWALLSLLCVICVILHNVRIDIVVVVVAAFYSPQLLLVTTTTTRTIRIDQILKNRNHIQITAHRQMIDDDSSIDFNDKYYNSQNNNIQERKLPSSSVLPIVSFSCTTRRNMIHQLFLLGIPIISLSNICHAEEEGEISSKSNRYENNNNYNYNRGGADTTTGSTINDNNTTTIIPTAPYATSVQALIPAIRVRYMIDQSIQIAQQIVTLQQQQSSSSSSSSSSSFESNQSEIISLVVQLQQLLLQPQNYTSIIIRNSSNNVNNNSMTSSKLAAIDSDTKSYSSYRIAKSYRDRYNENRALWDIWAQPGALLVQGGEIATWKRLQQQEQILERNDEIRAALNVYMNQIQYSTTQYTLRVPNEIRKQMIRTETLPDIIRQVVPSDMDLRTLYRNSVLTSIQDVQAELQYQLLLLQQQPPTTVTSNVDGIELLHLLQIAHDAILQWFQMIDPQEIHRAELEEERTRIVVLEYE